MTTASVQRDSCCLAWCCHGHKKRAKEYSSYCCNADFLLSILHCHNHFHTSSSTKETIRGKKWQLLASRPQLYTFCTAASDLTFLETSFSANAAEVFEFIVREVEGGRSSSAENVELPLLRIFQLSVLSVNYYSSVKTTPTCVCRFLVLSGDMSVPPGVILSSTRKLLQWLLAASNN